MAKKRIEVCRSQNTANERAAWMQERGYSVEGPSSFEKVIWDARDIINGTDNIASDEDGEVWLVIGTK